MNGNRMTRRDAVVALGATAAVAAAGGLARAGDDDKAAAPKPLPAGILGRRAIIDVPTVLV